MADNKNLADYLGLGALGAGGLFSTGKALMAGGRMAAPLIRMIPGLGMGYAAGDALYNGGGNFDLNRGEKPLYVRDASGQMVPNPDNPLARPVTDMAPGSPMSPMPASSPFPTQPNGNSPANPSVMQAPGSAPSTGFPAAPGATAGAPATGPSLPQGFPGTLPTLGPLSAPLLGGSTGGFGPGPSALPPAARVAGPASPGPTAPPPNLYNGPGSSSFGARDDQAPGGYGPGSNFTLSNFLKGGTNAAAAIQDAPKAPVWNIARFLTNNGGAFAPGWKSSNAWYNN